MTLIENHVAMVALMEAAEKVTNVKAAVNVHRAFYLHQIIDAVLTENVACLPEAE